MARTRASLIENSFARGLITEATGLNFPENAVTEAENVLFDSKGNVSRRPSFDVLSMEGIIPFTEGLIQSFLWETVGNNSEKPVAVIRNGRYVYFYDVTDASLMNLQRYGISQPITNRFDLRAANWGPAEEIPFTPVSFAAGSGYLFIAHPTCSPYVINPDEDVDRLRWNPINIQVRDLEGIQQESIFGTGPSNPPDYEPATLTSVHHYNLKNQGWNKNVRIGHSNNEL